MAATALIQRRTMVLTDRWTGLIYPAGVALAELLVGASRIEAGLAIHLVMLFVLPLHAQVGGERQRGLLTALMLVPLIRVVSLTTPFGDLPPSLWLAASGLPVLVAGLVAIRALRLPGAAFGLRVGNPVLQLGIALLGLPLGVAANATLEPALGGIGGGWPVGPAPAALMLVVAGCLEELVFRGVLLAVSRRALGVWAAPYGAALFAATYIPYQSAPYLVLVLVTGLVFGWLVIRSGSIVGVSLAHGLANLTLFVLLPLLSAAPPSDASAAPLETVPVQAKRDAERAEIGPPVLAMPPVAVGTATTDATPATLIGAPAAVDQLAVDAPSSSAASVSAARPLKGPPSAAPSPVAPVSEAAPAAEPAPSPESGRVPTGRRRLRQRQRQRQPQQPRHRRPRAPRRWRTNATPCSGAIPCFGWPSAGERRSRPSSNATVSRIRTASSPDNSLGCRRLGDGDLTLLPRRVGRLAARGIA
jgi:membrane protease YdiL (CAAX protease family)